MVVGGAVTACHGLLDVSNPNVVQDSDLANAGGANGRRLDAAVTFFRILPYTIADVGAFTDELTYDVNVAYLGYYNDTYALDQRNGTSYEDNHTDGSEPHLGPLDQVVSTTSLAIAGIREHTPDESKGDYLAEMFAYRGYAIVQMAEDICSGFPINDLTSDNQPLLSGAYSTDSALAYGIVQLDSAMADVSDSTALRSFAQVVKGRALLDLGRYAEAAAAVNEVQTPFVYTTDPTQQNPLVALSNGGGSYAANYFVNDREGGNGLAFVSEHDVRVPMGYAHQRASFSADSLFASLKYPTLNTPIVLASGIEARLIEAEAAIHDQSGNWLTIVNTLRASVGLADLSDPGTDSARIDRLYHERAFWLYLTGRRLGDLRRLMRNYGRAPETIFPTGSYPLGGLYKTSTSIPFSLSSESLHNPKITVGCTTP